MSIKKEYTVMGVNSGLGVSLFPFKKQLIGNLEERGIFHTPKNEQWELNFPGIKLWKKKPDTVPGPDVIITSPDCGSGSIFRLSRAKVMGDHSKNTSLATSLESITFLQPNFFLFENLDGLFKSFPKKKFKKILKDYRLVIHNDSVSKWGNSQKTRKRLVIVGIHRSLPRELKKNFRLPNYEHRIKTCRELYGDLKYGDESMGNLREPLESVISIHARKRMSLLQIRDEWMGRLKGKKRWTVLGGTFSTAPGVYLNLRDDYPATARKANRQFDHRGYTLSPRQLARVQGVPDNFQIYVGENKRQYWINKGRTVLTKSPPYEISVWFKKQLEKSLKQL